MNINIAICDDTEVCIAELKSALDEYISKHDNNNTFNIYSFTSGKTILDKIRKGLVPDIVFLDIELKEDKLGTNYGIELKKLLPDILLIYISYHSCYFKEIVRAEPFDFLNKPAEIMPLTFVLNRAIKRIHYLKHDLEFSYKLNGISNKIDLKDVLYFESQHRIINIYTTDKNMHQFYGRLDIIEKDIEEKCSYFLRANKSYYINFNFIEQVSNTHVVVQGININITKTYKERFFQKYISLT